MKAKVFSSQMVFISCFYRLQRLRNKGFSENLQALGGCFQTCLGFRMLFYRTLSQQRAFSHLKVRTKVRTKVHVFEHCIHLIRLVMVCNFTWHTYVLSSSPTLPASPYTWHWLFCKRACFLRQRVVNTAGSLEKRTLLEKKLWTNMYRCHYNNIVTLLPAAPTSTQISRLVQILKMNVLVVQRLYRQYRH